MRRSHRTVAISTLIGLWAILLLIGCAPSDRDTNTSSTPTQTVADEPRELTGEQLHLLTATLKVRLTEEADKAETRLPSELISFYEANHYQPAWVRGDGLTPSGQRLLTAMLQAEQDGLDPNAYNPATLNEAYERAYGQRAFETEVLASLDLKLSAAFMNYVDDLVRGHVNPLQSDAEVYLKPAPVAADSVLQDILSTPTWQGFADQLRPKHSQYDKLLNALHTYRNLKADGGWEPLPELPDGETVEPGHYDDRIPLLRERLAITGDLTNRVSTDTSTVLSGDVLAGLVRFQERHGLAVDSVLGPNTIATLNVPVEERVRQIELNLERWRWLPTDLGDRYVLVNLPEFTLHAYEDAEEVLTMPVVIGAEWGGRQTPVFSDEMTHVVFRPYWNVPQSITHGEILPQARKDPSYLSRKGYELVNLQTGEVRSSSDVPLDQIGSTYRVRQVSGPSNALGLVKFMFPNQHAIYLHDSPAKHLYDNRERAYSHGCIRLADPPAFASFVLGREGWDAERIQQAIATPERNRVNLEQHIPVYIMYLTSFVGEDGTIFFREDLYDYDADLNALFEEARSAHASASTAITSLMSWINPEA